MLLSLNCLIQGPKTRFTEKVGETYTNDDGIGIPFEDFTVSDFRKQLFLELDLMELKRQETVKTGKTRLGKELFNNIQANKGRITKKHFDHFVYLHLDFENSIKLNKQDYLLRLLENDKIICLLILYKYFIMEKYELSFEIFRERASPYIKILNIQNVFASIRKTFFHNIKDQDFDKIFKETTITLEENMAYTEA
uniref:Uncharacterized protein n=1 Tax=Rhizophagus irregularis (strain DAOM 181602 / DAOM 197198 / MUCL 43194) TaxID=747089 RepID=U9SMJ4_RHIID